MEIFIQAIEKKIKRNIIRNALTGRYDLAVKHITEVVGQLHASIPKEKRISYGIYYVIVTLGEKVYVHLSKSGADVFECATALYDFGEDDRQYYKSKGTALSVLSLLSTEAGGGFKKIVPYFKRSASSEYWDLREYAAGFFRKIIRAYPNQAREYLTDLTRAEDDKIRRWVSETLRPIRENSWFFKEPEYPISILRNLFKESSPYPRTSMGNNLSDLARRLPDLVCSLVEELVSSGDKNSYWIAYRACRNLIKKEPIKVMNLLGVDEYRYKKRIHKRDDYQRS